MAQSGLLVLLANVCFEGKNGHDLNWPLCRPMTRSGLNGERFLERRLITVSRSLRMTMELQPQHRALIKRLSHGGKLPMFPDRERQHPVSNSSLWAPFRLSWKPFIYWFRVGPNSHNF